MTRPIGIFRGPEAALGLLAFPVAWSAGFIGSKVALGEAHGLTVLLWRALPVALLLSPALVRHLRRLRRGSGLRPLARQALIGVFSQAGYLLAVYGAVALGISTGTTSLMDGVQPLVVAVLVGPLLGVAVTGRQWAALVVGMAGVGLVTYADHAGGVDTTPSSYLVPLLGMASLVAATFLERRTPVPIRPLERLAVHTAASAVVFAVLALATGTAAPPSATSFWLTVAWLAAVPTLAAYALYWFVLERHGITVVNSLMFMVPPVTTAWGAVAFGEPVGPMTVLGLGLAVGATWLAVGGQRHRVAGVTGEAQPNLK